jgi:hypothetical protein
LISALSCGPQEPAEELVRILRKEKAPGMNFGEVFDEFFGKYPERLRRSAQGLAI